MFFVFFFSVTQLCLLSPCPSRSLYLPAFLYPARQDINLLAFLVLFTTPYLFFALQCAFCQRPYTTFSLNPFAVSAKICQLSHQLWYTLQQHLYKETRLLRTNIYFLSASSCIAIRDTKTPDFHISPTCTPGENKCSSINYIKLSSTQIVKLRCVSLVAFIIVR